ncbi:dihydropteroate synthase [Marinilabiliaceae bacterium N1Y90]|nr:dihydropteroate synthase [Marinilabiliaceae bacterium N1Y90]
MGILNITPDSFYDGGNYQIARDIEQRCEQLIVEGADIIDVGAYSSRPGADDVEEKEELNRLVRALEIIRKKHPNIVISVDTFRASVAEEVVRNFNVDIINDISGGLGDEKMFETVSSLSVPYVLMHMKGTPKDMQKDPSYKNVVKEVSLFFSQQIMKLRALGQKDIILDPGFGFGKTLEHNYQLLSALKQFELFDVPILAGVSRKSMICRGLDINPKDALNGTTALNTIALLNGANILRVHDVKEAVECVKLVQQLLKA